MGITTKIWPASDEQIARCLEEPAHVAHLFVRCEDYAMIHDARPLERLLRTLAQVREVPTAADASFVMTREAVAGLRADAAHREILDFHSICSNGVQIADLVDRTVASERGLVFCVYEDW